MKIQVSIEEAKRIISDSLSSARTAVSDVVEAEILTAPAAPAAQDRLALPLDQLSMAVRMVRGFDTYNKLAAIKAVRQAAHDHGFTLGLGTAKNFVESIKP